MAKHSRKPHAGRTQRAGAEPEVAILLNRATQVARGIIQGITEYMERHRQWSILFDTLSVPTKGGLPGDWTGQGVIGLVNARNVETIQRLACPVVNVSADLNCAQNMPRVAINYRRTRRMAFEYLAHRGFQHLAYVSDYLPPGHLESLQAEFARDGLAVRIYQSELTAREDAMLYDQNEQFADWLEHLEKPVGLVANNDLVGCFVSQSCRTQSIPVPEQVAVVGIGNDPLLCRMCQPSLTSVEAGTVRQGYQAALMLDRLMRGRSVKSRRMLIPPVRVVSRRSSDTLAIDDPDVVEVMRFIRDHADEPLHVDDVLNAVPVSRRSLEYRFREWVGHSPAAEIRRVRLERVKYLLHETDMSMQAIANATGFNSPQYMSTYFRRYAGQPPGAYRMHSRHG